MGKYRPKTRGPATFDGDAISGEIALDPFILTMHGQEWKLAHLETFDAWEIDEIPESDPVGGMMELAMGPERWAEFSQQPIKFGTLKAIYEAYSKYCGITPGESRRSARS